MYTGLIAFTVALISSLGLTVPVGHLALGAGMVDDAGPRKVHLQPIPLLGGLAIYCGVLVAVLVSIGGLAIYSGVLIALLASMGGSALTQVLGIFLGATLVAVVGILDDRGLLHHQIKLFRAMPAAAIILLATGIRAHIFTSFWPGTAGLWADTALTL